MKIKTKITLWIGLLLFLIVLLTGMGVWSVSKIKKGTDHILASHHLSIQYAQDMQDALELSFYEKQAVQAFKVSLEKEKDVLSEIDMESPIGRIAQNFEKLQTDPEDKELIALVRRDIAEIIQTNMDAIVVKSNGASKMANTAMTRITLFGVVCFAVALLLLYSLPRSIAGPIAQLIEGTEEIAQENYAYRIPIQEDGELRKLAQSFNAMASKLEEYEGINLSKLWTEKKRMETIIDSIDDPIIILDEYNQIRFVNREALKIADLKITDILGINIQELAQTNIFIQLVIRDVFPTQLKKNRKKGIEILSRWARKLF